MPTDPPTDLPPNPRVHGHTHQALNPPTMCYSNTAVTSSDRCVPSSYYAALRDRMGKSPWVQRTKRPQNSSTTHIHERTRPPTHPHNDPTTHRSTDLPIHDVLQSCCGTYSGKHVGRSRIYPSAVLKISLIADSRPPRGASEPSLEGRLSKAPARRGGHRRPLVRQRHRGLLCGAGVETPRVRGSPSGARESQLSSGYVRRKIIQRSPLPRSIT